jgi:hypothetical protein
MIDLDALRKSRNKIRSKLKALAVQYKQLEDTTIAVNDIELAGTINHERAEIEQAVEHLSNY